jgi:sulfopyruvate decarboxylase TPP-binding subunit
VFDVEGVLGDFPGDARHLCQAPCKDVLDVSEKVDELAFLFGVQIGPDLHGFGRASGVDLHGLGTVIHLEDSGHWGIG